MYIANELRGVCRPRRAHGNLLNRELGEIDSATDLDVPVAEEDT